MLNPASPPQTVHMIPAAFMVASFLTASVHAVALLRGCRDHYHRAGFAIPFVLGAVAAPFQIPAGDWAARFLADYRPAKLAAIEGVYRTGSHIPLTVGGVAGKNGLEYDLEYGLEVPDGLSLPRHPCSSSPCSPAPTSPPSTCARTWPARGTRSWPGPSPGGRSSPVSTSGAVALAGTAVPHADAPELFHGLTHRALPLVVLSAVSGVAGLGLLATRRYLAARAAAAPAVAAILWSWGVAQYPAMLVGSLTVARSASQPAVLSACLIARACGALLLVPALWLLYATFQRAETPWNSHRQPR
ncbi:cytochrome ubiquinol oxidase subunit I [Streptomyces sp. NPDC100445]|uniref:cytochrome ubiquinol oxidase subunit I n=1 Tax=Streptomyces sp. NPDC100445 TaxID=3366102 RepID=UPI0037F5E53A